MSGPWEKYQPQATGPWTKFQSDVAVPPTDLTPGSREYADWAAQQARAGAKLPQAGPAPPAATAPSPDTSGIAPQALSGVNEGAANFLSLPNTIELGLRSAGPMIANAFGAHFKTPTESMLPDAGKSYRALADSIGAIKPVTDNPVGKFARRVGQEVGSNLIPVMGAPAMIPAALATLGGGAGAATAQLVAPDNPLAELVGETLGGGASLGVSNALERGSMKLAAPSVDELKTQASSLYDKAKDSGIIFPQPFVRAAASDIASQAISDGIDPTLHPGAVAALKRVAEAAGGALTVGDAQTLRRVIAAAARDPANPDQARIAGKMLSSWDKFVSSGAPELQQANAIYHQAKNGELIQQAIDLAGSRAGQFSGSGFENALRTEFRTMERQIIKGDLQGLSDDEVAAISKVARGGPIENILRFIGKFAPSGNISTIGGALAGNAFGGPVGAAAVLGGGALGRNAATALTSRNAAIAAALARRGSTAPVIPAITQNTQQIAQALALGGAANQNQNSADIALALMRPTATGQ